MCFIYLRFKSLFSKSRWRLLFSVILLSVYVCVCWKQKVWLNWMPSHWQLLKDQDEITVPSSPRNDSSSPHRLSHSPFSQNFHIGKKWPSWAINFDSPIHHRENAIKILYIIDFASNCLFECASFTWKYNEENGFRISHTYDSFVNENISCLLKIFIFFILFRNCLLGWIYSCTLMTRATYLQVRSSINCCMSNF